MVVMPSFCYIYKKGLIVMNRDLTDQCRVDSTLYSKLNGIDANSIYMNDAWNAQPSYMKECIDFIGGPCEGAYFVKNQIESLKDHLFINLMCVIKSLSDVYINKNSNIFNEYKNATLIEKLITLTLNEKIKWYTASEELFKTYNNDICIRLEVGEVFALKIDAKYYCASLDETEESDRLVTLYKAVLPRAQKTVEEKFFEGLW